MNISNQWNEKYLDILRSVYWNIRYAGLHSINLKKMASIYSDEIRLPKRLIGNSRVIYIRKLKYDHLVNYLTNQEEILNHAFNLTFAIAGDDLLRNALAQPLGFDDTGPYVSLGREIWHRYEWPETANYIQQDGLFVTEQSVFAVELKIDSKSSLDQLAKYIGLLGIESEKYGDRSNLGLLFIVPEYRKSKFWARSKFKPEDISSDLFSALEDQTKGYIREFYRENAPLLKRILDQVKIVLLTWEEMDSSLARYIEDLNATQVGDQTLIKLVAGMRNQIEKQIKSNPFRISKKNTMEKIEALARYAPIFRSRDVTFGTPAPSNGSGTQEDPLQLTGFHGNELYDEFIREMYHWGWVEDFDYNQWWDSEEGRRFMNDNSKIALANTDQLTKLMTIILRGERWRDGWLEDQLQSGRLVAIAERAKVILRGMKSMHSPDAE